MKARIAQYGFEEGEDFILIRQNGRTKNQGVIEGQ
ncbi:antA/AntB antirepressor family protein [Marinomonas primoryensis]